MGTSSVCKNGTGVTLASTTTGFEIPSDNVVFSQASGSPSAKSSGSGSPTSSPSASAKSGAGVVQASGMLFAAVLIAAAAMI